MTPAASIQYIDSVKGWLIGDGRASYAFAVDSSGYHLKHLYWGSPIAVQDVQDLAAVDRDWWRNTSDTLVMRQPSAMFRGFESAPRAFFEEVVSAGGFRFDEATIAVRSAATSGALLQYQDHMIETARDSTELAIRLIDASIGLAVTLHYRVSLRSPGIERWMTVRNDGDESVVVDRLCSASWPMPTGRNLIARNFFGHVQGEFQVEDVPVSHGRRAIGTRTGTSGHRGTPWLALHDQATEESGEVWSVALAYSGSWQIVTQASDDGGVHVVTGPADEEYRRVLEPRSQVTTPPAVGIYSARGFNDLSQQWHRSVNSHLPALVRPLPVMYNSWFALQFELKEATLLEQARLAASIGVELFVIDDGWFEGRHDDFHSLGRWTPDPVAFPSGLGNLADALAELGLNFGIWVEPEMCTPDSSIFQEHPEWLHGQPGKFFQTHRNQFVIDLTIAAARGWVIESISHAVTEARCSYVVWDMNRPVPIGRPFDDAVDRITHAQGLDLVIAELRERHPGVVWQACSGGGGRSDLGILRSMSLTWPSDNTDGHDRASIVQAASHVLPPSVLVHWLTDSLATNPTSDRLQQTESLTTRFHLAMNGVLGISADLTAWSADDLVLAREMVGLYKDVRSLVADGTTYRLQIARNALGLLYVDERQDHAVMIVVPPRSAYGETTLRVRLVGVDPDARYEFSGGEVLSGRLLMTSGIVLDGARAESWVLRFQRVC